MPNRRNFLYAVGSILGLTVAGLTGKVLSVNKDSWLYIKSGSFIHGGRVQLLTIYNNTNQWIKVGSCSGTCYGSILLTPNRAGDIVVYDYELSSIINGLEKVSDKYAASYGRYRKSSESRKY